MLATPIRQNLSSTSSGLYRSILPPLRSAPSASRALLPLRKNLSTTSSIRSSNNDEGGGFISRPGPLPLPANEQREFERLVRENANKLQFQPASAKSSEADAIHPQDRPRPSPDFEGDTNPQTGEIGGPKKEPLQWEKEWTYGGRATDF